MATQDKLLFRKGLLENLKNADIIPGSINFTTDEPGIYLDVEEDGTAIRRRIGDIIIVEKVEELFNVDEKGNIDLTPTEAAKALPKWSETALYYVKTGNALLKWGGEKDQTWTRLNPSLASVETGIADLDSRLNTLTDNYDLFVGTTYPTDKSALETLIGNNKSAINKAQGEIDALESQVNDLSSNVAQTYETKEDAASKLSNAKKYTDDLAEGAVATNASNISNEIERAEGVEEDLQEQITALSGTVTNNNTTTTDLIANLQSKDTELSTAIADGDSDTLENANQYTDGKVTIINNDIKTINQSISTLNSTLTSDISSAKEEAISAVTGIETDDFANKKTIYALKNYIDSAMQTADAMTFIGVLGESSQGQIQSLPAAEETKAGDTYKIGVQGSYLNGVYTPRGTTGTIVYVGDLLVAKTDGSNEYYHITSGYEDDYNTRLTRDDAYPNAVVLESIAGVYHGSVSFSGNADTNITATLTGEPDSNNVATMNVELSMVWGSF